MHDAVPKIAVPKNPYETAQPNCQKSLLVFLSATVIQAGQRICEKVVVIINSLIGIGYHLGAKRLIECETAKVLTRDTLATATVEVTFLFGSTIYNCFVSS